MKEFPYKTSFSNLKIRPVVSEEKDKYLALASLAQVSKFLPQIDTSKNADILPVAFDACVINRVNKNKDVVNTATALGMYKLFQYKPINVEHDRKKVIGMILLAGFSRFGSSEPLTEEEASKMDEPFNITLGGVVWRVVVPELADYIESSGDPSSDDYKTVSASWELGFTDYNVALLEGGEKNLKAAKKIITDKEEIAKAQDHLTSLGGDGKYEDLFAYRLIYDALPLGIGFTENPAAEVVGVATPQNTTGIVIPPAVGNPPEKTEKPKPVMIQTSTKDEVGITIQPAVGIPSKDSNAQEINENQNKISQLENCDVKKERTLIMEIKSIKDITDENLKQCSASVVAEFISSELKKGNDEWLKDKTAISKQLEDAKASEKKTQEDYSKVQEELKTVKAAVETLQAEKAEQLKVEKFNARMTEMAEAFEFDDEARATITEDIKALASDEDFKKYFAKAKVLFKAFAKKCKPVDTATPDQKAKADDDMDDSEAKKKKAKETAASVIANAVDNAKLNGSVIATSGTDNKTMKEKYSTAFALNNFVITK